MATLPSIESILFEAYRIAGLNTLPNGMGQSIRNSEKDRLIGHEMSLKVYQETYAEIFVKLLQALGSSSDMELNDDLLASLWEFQSLSANLQGRVWTYGASEKQVLWTALSFCYVPWLARKAGLWYRDIEVINDIPGGQFWYLPQPSSAVPNELELPVVHVCRWLLKLLGVANPYRITALEAKSLAGEMTSENADTFEDEKEALTRNLYNWISGEAEVSANSIDKYFDEASNSKLQFEIKNEDGTSISLRTIWKVFTYVRLIQEAYSKLIECLCPGVDKHCADPSKNKVLQLITLYKNIYSWTKESYLGDRSTYLGAEHMKADQRFIARLNEHPRAFELNVYDMASGIAVVQTNLTAELITDMLQQQADSDVLNDIEPVDDASSMMVKRSSRWLKGVVNDRQIAISELSYQVATGNAKQAVMSCNCLVALFELLRAESIPWKLKQVALKRLNSMRLNEWDQMHFICSELALYLNEHAQKNRRDTQQRVEYLLDKAQKHQKADAFKAPILQYRAKHLLAKNFLEDALECFEAAFTACSENGHGPLKGEIARDALAVSLVDHNLQKKHEKWFRTILFENLFEDTNTTVHTRTDELLKDVLQRRQPKFEDIAAQCAEYFWDTLYRPYVGIPKMAVGFEEHSEAFKELLQMIVTSNFDALKAWIKNNKDLAKNRFRDVRGQTLIILLINMRYDLAKREQLIAPILAMLDGPMTNVVGSLDNAIQLVAENLPKKSINTNDFKGQSPLMLATNSHLMGIVSLLIKKGAELDQQDFIGRTALHAAAAADSNDCMTVLLDAGAKPEVRDEYGMNVLHTAVRCGRPRMVKALMRYNPALAAVKDHQGLLPKDYVGIHESPEWIQHTLKNSRLIGTKSDYYEVERLLNQAETWPSE